MTSSIAIIVARDFVVTQRSSIAERWCKTNPDPAHEYAREVREHILEQRARVKAELARRRREAEALS